MVTVRRLMAVLAVGMLILVLLKKFIKYLIVGGRFI